jgi:hypothetical protein
LDRYRDKKINCYPYKRWYNADPNPDKPEPRLTVKTKKETKKIEFGTQELTKVKTNIS